MFSLTSHSFDRDATHCECGDSNPSSTRLVVCGLMAQDATLDGMPVMVYGVDALKFLLGNTENANDDLHELIETALETNQSEYFDLTLVSFPVFTSDSPEPLIMYRLLDANKHLL